jgi:thiamine pyrophosphokinase
MSSHHFVKEKQEPALIIADLDGFDEEYLGQLLEWSPTVLVPSHLIEKVLSLGIKIDVVLVPDEGEIKHQEHIKLVKTGGDFLNDALKFLLAEGYPAVNIVHHSFETKSYLLFIDKIDIVVFKGNQKIYPITSGFSKWQTEGEKISVFHTEQIQNLSISGLEKISENEFKTLKDGFFSFTFEQPFIFIAEEI